MRTTNFLKGRTAVVTGATSGIGATIAETLASNGASVVINGFGDADQINEKIRKISETYGVVCIYSDADLRRSEAVDSMFTMIARHLGTVDILVNNAGVQHVAPIEKFSEDEWDRVISTNLSACFRTTRLAIGPMREANWGRIINIASVHALVGSVNKCAYVAAKHGVVGLTKVVALETATSGITCNAICPGWVRTPLVEAQIEEKAAATGQSIDHEANRLVAEKMPSGEFVSMESIAQLTTFLCSDNASQITGSQYAIDGGWSAR